MIRIHLYSLLNLSVIVNKYYYRYFKYHFNTGNSIIEKIVKWLEVSVQFSSVTQLCPTLCDPMNRSIAWHIDGETVETVADFIFLGSKITGDSDFSHEIKKTLTPWKESYDQPRQHIKKQRYYFVSKDLSSQGYGFSNGHVWL